MLQLPLRYRSNPTLLSRYTFFATHTFHHSTLLLENFNLATIDFHSWLWLIYQVTGSLTILEPLNLSSNGKLLDKKSPFLLMKKEALTQKPNISRNWYIE